MKEFAKKWIEEVWREDFRFGVITTDPESGLPGWTIKGRRNKNQLDQYKFLETKGEVIRLLQASDITKAIALIEQRNLTHCIRIVQDKETLIETVADVLRAGANAWDNGRELAWYPSGLFICHFWNERN